MFKRAGALTLNEDQKQQLQALAGAGRTPQRLARKCEALLLASQGISNYAIARQTGLSRPCVLATRTAFRQGGLEALRRPQKRQRSRKRMPRTPAGRSCQERGAMRLAKIKAAQPSP